MVYGPNFIVHLVLKVPDCNPGFGDSAISELYWGTLVRGTTLKYDAGAYDLSEKYRRHPLKFLDLKTLSCRVLGP